jgi:hypothetical protein
MASSKDVVTLYMAMAGHDANEAKANLDELSRRSSPVSGLISGIQNKGLKLLEFVTILGDYLTHEEPKKRKNGNYTDIRLIIALGCLSGILASLPPRTLNRQEVDVMTTFYCDRMEDEISTKENLEGLATLQDMPGFGNEEAAKVCDAYFLCSRR